MLMLIIGIFGMVLVLVAFLGAQKGYFKKEDLSYDLINFVGSLLLVIYAIDGKSWPFVILNSIWGLYSLIDIFKDLKNKKGKK